MARDSSVARDEEQAVKCEKHALYYNQAGECWKCAGSPSVDTKSTSFTGVPYPEGATLADVAPPERDLPLTLDERAAAAKADPMVRLLREIRAVGAPSAEAIIEECLRLAGFLARKNKAYGDSALKPVRVLSKADPAEQIRVRLDDKLSRLVRGELAGEDAILDLVGYYILLKIAERSEK